MAVHVTSTKKYIKNLSPLLAFILLASIVAACSEEPATAEVTPTQVIATNTPEITPDSTSASGENGQTAGNLPAPVASRTPQPTTTPSRVDERIDQFASEAGLEGKSFLGLDARKWIDLLISVSIFLVGYAIIIRLLKVVLRWVLRRRSQKTGDFETDDHFLDDIKGELRALVIVFLGRFAIFRLDFLSEELRRLLDDIFFIVALVAAAIIALKFLNLIIGDYRDDLSSDEERTRLNPVIQAMQRLSEIILLVFFGSIGLSHFGSGVNALAASLLAIGLIVALGAQDNISDVINGFIMLLNQPFRVGDTIWIKEIDTTGEVIEIGTLTTLIRTDDSRDVIVPNSQLGQNQVINYSFPDPSYRVQTDLGVAYGSDMEQVRKVIEDTVRGVEGVLLNNPVDIYFLEFGDSSRLIRVRWWIESYGRRYTMIDQVNTAIEAALDEAGIDMPNLTFDQNIQMDSSLIKELRRSEND